VVACKGTVDVRLADSSAQEESPEQEDSSEQEAHKVLVLLAAGARVELQFEG